VGSMMGRVVNYWRNRKTQKRQQEFEKRLQRDYLKLSSLEISPVIDWDRVENPALLRILGVEEGDAREAGQARVQD
jgi:hypothetical protein